MYNRVHKNSMVLIRGLLNKINKEYDCRGISIRWCQNHIRWIEVKLDFKITDVNGKINQKNLFISDEQVDEKKTPIPDFVKQTKQNKFKEKVRNIKVDFSPEADDNAFLPSSKPNKPKKYGGHESVGKELKSKAFIVGAGMGKEDSARIIFAKEIEEARRDKDDKRRMTSEFAHGSNSKPDKDKISDIDTGTNCQNVRKCTGTSFGTPKEPADDEARVGYNVARFSDMRQSKIRQKGGDSDPCDIDDRSLV